MLTESDFLGPSKPSKPSNAVLMTGACDSCCRLGADPGSECLRAPGQMNYILKLARLGCKV